MVLLGDCSHTKFGPLGNMPCLPLHCAHELDSQAGSALTEVDECVVDLGREIAAPHTPQQHTLTGITFPPPLPPHVLPFSQTHAHSFPSVHSCSNPYGRKIVALVAPARKSCVEVAHKAKFDAFFAEQTNVFRDETCVSRNTET